MLIDYYENEKELLKTFLRELLFNEDNTTNSIYHLNLADMDVEREKRECRNYNYLELIIRPECNLKCEYCYIAQHGKELYPIEQRVSNETILKNLNMLLNYIYNKNDLFIRRYSLFSGDLFYDNFIFDIFEVFYKYLYKQFIKYRQVQRPHSKFPIVLDIPTNPTFLHDDEKTARFEEWIDKFEDIGVRLYLSISTDGKYVIDTRERNGMTDEFWDKIFKFCLKHGYFFHPMIAAANIENWIQNYDWWRDEIKKYGFNDVPENKGHYLPMMLEVRNDDWTPDKIQSYLDLIDHMIDDRLHMCNDNMEQFVRHIFMKDAQLEPVRGYDPTLLVYDIKKQRLLCDLQTCIHIQMNDLTIVPCHRTSYSQFHAGRFVVKDNVIVDVEPLNVALWMNIMNIRRETLPYCQRCEFQPYCISGCLGAQFESNGELFCPCISVCDMFRAKLCFIIWKYEKIGVLQTAMRLGCIAPKELENIQRIKDTWIYKQMENCNGRYPEALRND